MSKRVTVIVEGVTYVVEVGDLRERPIKATVNQRTYHVRLPDPGSPVVSAESEPAVERQAVVAGEGGDDAAIVAPMPGDILEVNVRPGQGVKAGDLICVLEAMKMRNKIRSSRAGVIASVDVSPGQAVGYGAVLVTFE